MSTKLKVTIVSPGKMGSNKKLDSNESNGSKNKQNKIVTVGSTPDRVVTRKGDARKKNTRVYNSDYETDSSESKSKSKVPKRKSSESDDSSNKKSK